MNAQSVLVLIRSIIGGASQLWDFNSIQAGQHINFDRAMLGEFAPVLINDINVQWCKWFLDGICDIEPLIKSNKNTYAHVFQEIFFSIKDLNIEGKDREVRDLASVLAQFVHAEIEQKINKGRGHFTLSIKQSLIDLAKPNPRCWYCGYLFTDWALEKFLEYPDPAELITPLYYDYMTGHGLVNRDYQIEIDHLVPVADGGKEDLGNLKLSCGWCNKSKSDLKSLYSANTSHLTKSIGKKLLSAPQPFWIVRIMSLKRCCSVPDCSRDLSNAQLFVAPKNGRGAMNPLNIKIVCEDHDPIQTMRWIVKR
jgi:hypothetical protein